jgi:adenine-specific DNA-methyltransferase
MKITGMHFTPAYRCQWAFYNVPAAESHRVASHLTDKYILALDLHHVRMSQNGVVYTPKEVCDQMVQLLADLPDGASVLDPCCGRGAFLDSIVRLRPGLRVSAVDISEEIRSCQDSFPQHSIQQQDFMETSGAFDAVIGNPPYIRLQDIPMAERVRLREMFPHLRGNFDLYMAFIFKALSVLRPGGLLVFIIPRGWLTSKAGESVRDELFGKKQLQCLVDLKGVTVFREDVHVCIAVVEKDGCRDSYLKSEQLPPVWREQPFVDAGESKDQRCVRLRTGIKTLCDSVFVIRPSEVMSKTDALVTFTKRGTVYNVESAVTKRILKVSRWVEELIIFPYDDEGNIYTEETMSTRFAHAYAYLEAQKDQLDQREKGVKTYSHFYAYGRRQGLKPHRGDRLFVSDMVSSGKLDKYLAVRDVPLFRSGSWLDPGDHGDEMDLQNFRTELLEREARIELHSAPKRGGWYTVTGNSFR